VSHRRGRPEHDPDGAEALLGWSGLTEEDAMEWGRRISRPPAPGTWRSGALPGPPTHAWTPAGELDGARARCYRGTGSPASKVAVVPGRDLGRRLREAGPCRPRRQPARVCDWRRDFAVRRRGAGGAVGGEDGRAAAAGGEAGWAERMRSEGVG
jgi:hypothetical protein